MKKIAFTILQLMSAQCDIGCKWAGRDYGFYRDKNCHCVDIISYSDITKKRNHIPSKTKHPTNSHTIWFPPQKQSYDDD